MRIVGWVEHLGKPAFCSESLASSLFGELGQLGGAQDQEPKDRESSLFRLVFHCGAALHPIVVDRGVRPNRAGNPAAEPAFPSQAPNPRRVPCVTIIGRRGRRSWRPLCCSRPAGPPRPSVTTSSSRSRRRQSPRVWRAPRPPTPPRR